MPTTSPLPRRAVALLLVALPVVLNGVTLPAHADADRLTGRVAADFTLRDYRGAVHSLSALTDKRAVVVAFLGAECPLAKLYGARLNELQARFGDRSVAVVGINSNRQDTLSEIAEYARVHEIAFPLLKDPGNRVADAFGADRTPQVFLLDQERVVRYAGAIDDRYGIGYQKAEASATYLVDAIEAVLAGEEVETPTTNPVGCRIGRVDAAQSDEPITYAEHVAPIFNARCVECHRAGEVAPFPMATYDDVLGWGDMIVEVIGENRMPPWYADPRHGEFKNDARLTNHEKQLIRRWVEGGSPEGDSADLPEPPRFAEGWRMPEPQQVIRMGDTPFAVPAEGVVDYQYYVVDPEWDEDKYVVAAEARPGNRSVVHHILAYLVPPGMDLKKDRPRTAIVGYAPGAAPNLADPGTAILAPAGSKILFEMHYTPNGSAQEDLSYVGVSFTEKENVEKLIRGRAALNHDFTIPPGDSNYRVTAQYRSKQDEMLLSMTPHMHLRGKAFRYEAVYPDGRSEVLLDVPEYDFNWQLTYELAEPKRLPKGTQIACTAHFDNSEANPANPDATAAVRWGEQSWNEMMIGFFDVVDATPSGNAEEPVERSAGRPASDRK